MYWSRPDPPGYQACRKEVKKRKTITTTTAAAVAVAVAVVA
jgi:hypothetical protein